MSVGFLAATSSIWHLVSEGKLRAETSTARVVGRTCCYKVIEANTSPSSSIGKILHGAGTEALVESSDRVL